MLRLNLDQADLLDQLVVRRHAAAISGVLAEAWPQMTQRLGERWPAFVEAALQQGRQHGIAHPQDLARYASLWCIWGPGFDAKPSFAWAAEVLADSRRPAALKVHQLVHRSREEVGKLRPAAPGAPPVVTPAQFEAALEKVERQVGSLAAARAVFPEATPTRVPIVACDLATLDLMVAEVEGLQEYRHGPTGWQRAAVTPLGLSAVHWTRAPAEPLELAVPSRALRAGPVARLNLKVQAQAVCDPRVHPEVVHTGAQGRLAWKGRDTARLSLALYAPPDAAVGEPGFPGVAAESQADVQRVRVGGCGLRDAGAPFGEAELAVRVVAATQWLVEVRHAAWPQMAWPAAERTIEAAPPATCKLQADGAPRDVAEWQRRWLALHGAFRDGMDKLFNAWNRAFDGQGTRLEVEASPLVGQGGITWGWRRVDASKVAMRTEGVLEFIAFAIDLQLVGELAHGGARSRIRVACKGRSELRMTLSQLGEEGPEGQDLKAAQRTWRFPCTLEVEPLASADLVSLFPAPLAAVTPVGAFVGECGLRPRPDGAGFQWFFALRTEPFVVSLQSADPIVGSGRLVRPLLPAMTLVDWSAG
jgi:hypothetical protein